MLKQKIKSASRTQNFGHYPLGSNASLVSIRHNEYLLIFIDETSTATHRARRYGRNPRGRRLVAAIAHGHCKTTPFVAGLRYNQLSAPLVIDGPMTAPPSVPLLKKC